MTIAELREQVEEEAIEGARKLLLARHFDHTEMIGYWTAYIRDREAFLISLAKLKDEK